MHRLTELWAWVVTDAAGDEGVLRRHVGEAGTQPLIADSEGRALLLAGEAERAAVALGLPRPHLVRFTRRD